MKPRYTVAMNVIIKQLRAHGARRTDSDLNKDAGVRGVLTFTQVGKYGELKVHGTDDTSFMRPLIPSLYDAYVVSLHTRGMMWRGFQRSGGKDDKNAATHLQEWAVEVLDRV